MERREEERTLNPLKEAIERADRRAAMEREEHTMDTLKVGIERADRKQGRYQGMESRMSMTGEGARSDQISGERERRERNQQDIREAMKREDERILDRIRAAIAMAAHNGASFYSENDLERLAQHDGEHKTRLIRDTTKA
jgi:hypothetical protein